MLINYRYVNDDVNDEKKFYLVLILMVFFGFCLKYFLSIVIFNLNFLFIILGFIFRSI